MNTNGHAISEIIANVTIVLISIVLGFLFLGSIFQKQVGCEHQWTVIDKYIIADKYGLPNYYTVAKSNPDGSIIKSKVETIYYEYQVGDPATICNYDNRFISGFPQRVIEGK